MPDSVNKVNKKYYPQTLLEECKYEIKTTERENLIINDDLEQNSSDDETENESDSESDNESDNKTNNE